MTTARKIDTSKRSEVRRFLGVASSLYSDSPLWVPPLRRDALIALDARRHPFYRHSEAAFFVAESDGVPVGRIAVLDNRNFNEHRGHRDAFFYWFDSIDAGEIAGALFDAASQWASDRGLEQLIGPKGMLPTDGLGLLVEGYEHPPGLAVPYNHPYYETLVEGAGFEKETDFLSGYLEKGVQHLPQQFFDLADAASNGLGYEIKRFTGRRELRRWVPRIGAVYNETFSSNWEFCPLTDEESRFILDRFTAIADPRLVYLVMHNGEIAGHFFILPDPSPAIRRTGGRLFPFGWAAIMREVRRTDQVNLFGLGLKPEHRGVGANAVLFAALARGAESQQHYRRADIVQIEEGNARMLSNMTAVGVPWHKRHRIYHKRL